MSDACHLDHRRTRNAGLSDRLRADERPPSCRAWLVGLVAGASAVLGGCVSAPAPRVLLALPVPAIGATGPAPVERPAGLPVLAVRRVTIPEYLESRRVRYRADASALAEWPNTYWAERIEVAVTRSFVASLAAELPAWTLCEASCANAAPGWELQVDIAPLDFLRQSGHLLARAHVSLAPAADPASARALRTQGLAFDITATADTPQAHAEAIAELLRQLSVQVARVVVATGAR